MFLNYTLNSIAFTVILLINISNLNANTEESDKNSNVDYTNRILKLGIPLSLSGSLKEFAESAQKGIEIAKLMRPNLYLLGQKIVINPIIVDDHSNKQKLDFVFNDLINKHKIDVLIGPLDTSLSLHLMKSIEEANIPTIVPWATNPKIFKNKKNLFPICFSDSFQGMAAAKYARLNLKAMKAAILFDEDMKYSKDIAKYFEKNYIEEGGKIVEKIPFTHYQHNFRDEITSILKKNPKVIFCPCYTSNIIDIIKELKKQNYKGKIIATDIVEVESFIAKNHKILEGLIFSTHFDAESEFNEKSRKFIKNFKKNYPKDHFITSIEALYFEAYNYIVDIIEKKVLSLNRDQIRNTLASPEIYSGITGDMIYDPNDFSTIKPAIIMTILKNGKLKRKAIIEP